MTGAMFHMRTSIADKEGYLIFKLYDNETVATIDWFLWFTIFSNRCQITVDSCEWPG